MKLETVVIPVSDVDRAKEFYESLGWRLDADLGSDDFRIVQLTPPGSGCSIQFGIGPHLGCPRLGAGSPRRLRHRGGARRARRRRCRRERGLPRRQRRLQPLRPRRPGRAAPIRNGAPTRRSRSSAIRTATSGSCRRSRTDCPAASTRRRPRSAPSADLASALERAAAAHGEHEKRTGEADANWPEWYAAYMVAEQTGAELPT